MIALFLASAVAADHEVSVEIGHLQNSDPTYELFTAPNHNGMLTYGARGGVAVHDRVAVIASWSHTRRGAWVSAGDQSFVAAWAGDFWGVGVRADLEPLPWLLPYLSAEALLVRGLVRFDENPDVSDNVGQLADAALAPGGAFAVGVELRIPKGSAPFTLAWHLQAGYGLVGKLSFSTIDEEMQPGGLLVRGGMGVRF